MCVCVFGQPVERQRKQQRGREIFTGTIHTQPSKNQPADGLVQQSRPKDIAIVAYQTFEASLFSDFSTSNSNSRRWYLTRASV